MVGSGTPCSDTAHLSYYSWGQSPCECRSCRGHSLGFPTSPVDTAGPSCAHSGAQNSHLHNRRCSHGGLLEGGGKTPGSDRDSRGRHPHTLGHSNLASRCKKRSARGLGSPHGVGRGQMHRRWSRHNQVPRSLGGWVEAGLGIPKAWSRATPPGYSQPDPEEPPLHCWGAGLPHGVALLSDPAVHSPLPWCPERG